MTDNKMTIRMHRFSDMPEKSTELVVYGPYHPYSMSINEVQLRAIETVLGMCLDEEENYYCYDNSTVAKITECVEEYLEWTRKEQTKRDKSIN